VLLSTPFVKIRRACRSGFLIHGSLLEWLDLTRDLIAPKIHPKKASRDMRKRKKRGERRREGDEPLSL